MYLPIMARCSKDTNLAVEADKKTQAILKFNWVCFCPTAGTAILKNHSNMNSYNKLNMGEKCFYTFYHESTEKSKRIKVNKHTYSENSGKFQSTKVSEQREVNRLK